MSISVHPNDPALTPTPRSWAIGVPRPLRGVTIVEILVVAGLICFLVPLFFRLWQHVVSGAQQTTADSAYYQTGSLFMEQFSMDLRAAVTLKRDGDALVLFIPDPRAGQGFDARQEVRYLPDPANHQMIRQQGAHRTTFPFGKPLNKDDVFVFQLTER